MSTLREIADRAGIRIGTCVNRRAFENDPVYRDVLAREFNIVTPENVMKPGPIHPEPDRYDFTAADALVAFAEEHDMQVHGHALVWHEQNPTWLTEGAWTRSTMLDVMREHISSVVGRYRGRVHIWDVLNEAIISEGSALRPTLWHETVGPDYIDHAFRWAHEADPGARLFCNDFGADGMNEKSDAMYALVKGMLARGVPIHGVGLQMHVSLRNAPDADGVARNIARYGKLGLEVQITEMDVCVNEPGESGSLPERLEAQAEVYRQVVDAIVGDDAGTALIMWGLSDKYSWLPRFKKREEWGLILDEEFAPKPAYHALHDVLSRAADGR